MLGEAVDEAFMRLAEAEAEEALRLGEVPVGCVIVRDGDIVARGHNLTNAQLDATRHAEMVAVDTLAAAAAAECASKPPSAGSKLTVGRRGQKLLKDCTLYVTCEPCIMCAGALAQLGLSRAVFGCANDKFGGNGSVLSLHISDATLAGAGWPGYSITQGVRAEEAVALFKTFYQRENSRAPIPNPSVAKRRKGVEAPLSSSQHPE